MKNFKASCSCSACGSEANVLFKIDDINQKMTEKFFEYNRCSSCGLIFIDQIPENLSKYYGSNYSAYQRPDFSLDLQISEQERGKLDVVKQYSSGNKMLEIGPGVGGFSYFAKQTGYELDVIEMDKDCCNYLKNTIGVNLAVHAIDIPTAINEINKKYDVIVLWHVLEHLVNPWEVIKAISKALTPKGVVVIGTPNPESIQFKLFKQYWKHVDAPRHLSLIPMQVLNNKALSFGLRLVNVTTLDKPSIIFHSYGWWIESLKNYQVENPNSIVTKFFRNSRMQHLITFTLYKYLLTPLEKREGNGAAYTAIFTKE